MQEYIRLRVVRTVEEIVEYVPDRRFHGDETDLGDIANSVIKAIASGALDLDDLECLGESEREMSVEIEAYGAEEIEISSPLLDHELDLEEGFIEDEY